MGEGTCGPRLGTCGPRLCTCGPRLCLCGSDEGPHSPTRTDSRRHVAPQRNLRAVARVVTVSRRKDSESSTAGYSARARIQEGWFATGHRRNSHGQLKKGTLAAARGDRRFHGSCLAHGCCGWRDRDRIRETEKVCLADPVCLACRCPGDRRHDGYQACWPLRHRGRCDRRRVFKL
jgi:hypothetical protein